MDYLEQHYNRLLNRLIETAQMNEWLLLEQLLFWLKDNFVLLATFVTFLLAVLILHLILKQLDLYKYLLKLKMLFMIKIAPRTLTIIERTPKQTPYPYSANYLALQKQFEQAGFESGKHYHNELFSGHNLAVFYKDGVCGVINSEGKKDWFELVGYLTNGEVITVSSDGVMTLFDRLPNHDYVPIDADCSVSEAYELLQNKRRGRRLHELSAANFKETYEDAYRQYMAFLKERY